MRHILWAPAVLALSQAVSTFSFGQTTVPVDRPQVKPLKPTLSMQPKVAASSVQVTASLQAEKASISSSSVKSADVLSSAGTYGDFEKYLQILPGVVFNSDESDDVLVRGGHPVENLYLVDGIEVPNINHITGEGTTGGFTSMVDTSSIQNIDLHSGGYSAAYAERLSSVISINTLAGEAPGTQKNDEVEVGYAGAGGHKIIQLGPNSYLLVSAHRSLLNMLTSDIGLDGVPTYTNALGSGSFALGPSDLVTTLSLSGQDSIHITPSKTNALESNTIQTQYAGWRTTNGVRWQHAYSYSMVGVLTVSDSEQSETIAQQNQSFTQSQRFSFNPAANPLTQVYNEHTHDGTTILQYQLNSQIAPRIDIDAGSQFRLDRIRYAVTQPAGQQSPFSANPGTSDSTSFAPQFASGGTGSWVELSASLTKNLSFTTGGRLQTFSTGGAHVTITPRIRASYKLGEHQSLYAALGEYAQQPAFIYLEAYPQNHSLLPTRVQHFVLGAELLKTERTRITLEAYRKRYRDYPVASEYPQLSMANMVDTLGQQFLWLPLTSQGHGRNYGVELAASNRLSHGLFLQSSIAYARAFYSGKDGIYRPGNFDYPVVANVAAIWRSPRRYEASTRYEYTTGRPYTPFLMADSLAQDRGIYDLSQVNGKRGSFYSRLDLQFARFFHPADRDVSVFGGLENAFDRQNLLGYAWMPHCGNSAHCIAGNGAYTAVPQIGLYPNAGARIIF